MLTSEQLRAARAMLRLEQAELAEAAGLNVHTIKRLEAIPGVIEARTSTVRRLAEALEARGIVFIDDADAPGLRLVARRA